jgi:hypothetical protein
VDRDGRVEVLVADRSYPYTFGLGLAPKVMAARRRPAPPLAYRRKWCAAGWAPPRPSPRGRGRSWTRSSRGLGAAQPGLCRSPVAVASDGSGPLVVAATV